MSKKTPAPMPATLPIYDVIPELITALRDHPRAVLQAPPGAGKTTTVPLELWRALAPAGKIIMLEPRRLAARAAAERLADLLGETVGKTIGYRMRGESKSGPETKIEVVTEGILTRMIQSDPELGGVDLVIFDEFHERSLNADLGLALALEISDALRDDLKILVMSATLDAAPVAKLLGNAPIITSDGRSFPVDLKWLERPRGKARLEEATADLVLRAARETEGGILVFLPGEGEIRRCEALLRGKLGPDCHIRPLFGAMEFAAQRAAIRPETDGRKVVLATSIAETSLTIQDIRVVIDSGMSRRARFDPGSGMSRLVTERASRAEATQRSGRAGRVAPGVAYRLWSKGEEGAMPAFAPAEIETADLTGFALELAQWGAAAADLALLTHPNAGMLAEAQAVLRMLGALDAAGRITAHGKEIARMPLHPRLAHMLAISGAQAADIAALLADRDPLPRGAPVDVALRLEALADPRRFEDRRPYRVNRGAVSRMKTEAKRLRALVKKPAPKAAPAEMIALAYPDRIGAHRKGDAARFVLSGGKGALMEDSDPMAGARFIVATDLDGNPREARIRQAIEISQGQIRALFADQIAWRAQCAWSKRERRVVARKREMFGAIALDDRIWKDAPNDVIAEAMLEGVRDLGLAPSDAAKRFLARVALCRSGGADLPDMSEDALLADLETWLLPHISGVKTADHWKKFDILEALRARLDWGQMQALDHQAPAHFTTPLGRKIPIDYGGEHPEITLRLQELFGQATHPHVGKTPLRVTLLSPGHKPVQTTMDIPGFWQSSYADVRKDMRGRYPKHPWPENPLEADPTLRAKKRQR